MIRSKLPPHELLMSGLIEVIIFSTCSLPCRKTSSQNSFIAPVSTQSKIAPDHTPTHNGGVVTVTKNREEQDVFTDTQVSETTFSSN